MINPYGIAGAHDMYVPTIHQVDPIFQPRKHTRCSYRSQQRAAKKRKGMQARKSKRS